MLITRFLGDNLVLLTSKSGEKIKDIVKSNTEWFDCFFEELKPWSESLAVSYKRVWVRCYGLPIHLWSKECFSKVVEDVATLMEVDEASLSWHRLEYARFQVRMLKSRKAELSKGFRINGCLCNITLVEEMNYYDGVKFGCNCEHSLEGSSDSVSSFETFVEDSLFSANLSNERGGTEKEAEGGQRKRKGKGRGGL